MNKLLSAFLLVLIGKACLASGPSQPLIEVGWTYATDKVLSASPPKRYDLPVVLRGCRNEWVPFQMVFRSETDIEEVTLRVTDLAARDGDTIPSSSVELFLVEYVPMTAHANTTFPVVDELPDPLPPLKGSFRLTGGRSQPIWVNIRVPDTLPAGTYEGTLVAEVGQPPGRTLSKPVSLTVWDFSLPRVPRTESSYAIWYDLVQRYYGLPDEKKREVFDKLYWYQVDHWLPPADLPVPVLSPEADDFLDDPMVFNYRMPYSHDLGQLKATHDTLKSKGWLEKGYFYVYDEPKKKDFPAVREAGHRIFAAATDWRYLITTAPAKELYNCVNLWVPMPRGVTKDTIRERQAAGDQMWWYTCIGPQKPYPTYFIDEWGTAPVILFWLQVDYGYTGSLYWSTTAWLKFERGTGFLPRDQAPDIYDDPVRYPNVMGDGFLIWPSRDGSWDPVGSIRLKLVREGIEDAEFLYLLVERLEQVKSALNAVFYDPRERAEEMVRRVAGDYTSWTRDPEVIEQGRAAVAEEILHAGDPPLALVETEPPELTKSSERTAKVRGIVEHGARVTINGKAVPVDRFGQFLTTVALGFGRNPVSIELAKGDGIRRIERTLLRVKPVREEPSLYEGTVSVPRLSHPPAIDGDFASPAWRQAQMLTGLVRPDGTPAEQPTEVYIGWTDDSLYVGFTCIEPEVQKLRSAGGVGDEEIWTGDTVEVYLDPAGERSRYFLFGVNPAGTQADLTGDREGHDVSWKAFWNSFTAVEDNSWVAQFEIPIATLNRLPPRRGERWGAQFVRRRRGAAYEFSSWGPAVDYRDLDRFGTLAFK